MGQNGGAHMLGFIKKLFSSEGSSGPEAEMEHKGFHIKATPIPEGGQYRVCGVISKGDQEKKFIRSDLIPEAQLACDISMDKAVTIIDQQGDKLFKRHNI